MLVEERGRKIEEVALGRQVDTNDVLAMEKWAIRLCEGLSTEWLADALQVDATVDAVVSKITESIPDISVRKRIEVLCRREILKTGEKERGPSSREANNDDG